MFFSLEDVVEGGVVIIRRVGKAQSANMGGLENYQKYYRKYNDFLAQIYIKMTLPSSQVDATLSNTTHAISLIFLTIRFYLHGEVSPLKTNMAEILFSKITRHVGWKNIFPGKNVLKN